MNQMMAIARKELASYFRSPVALIFIGIYLLAAVFTFFFGESSIFLRNVADARALFSWQPLLLAFLAAAISMRAWSDEQRMGTLELLLTMSVPTSRLVVGKFLAALALVGIALSMTISMPITVAMLGDLDWGPVVGGYLGTMLMAGTYLAVGFAISAATANAVVALMLAAAANFFLWGVGNAWFVGLFGHETADILRAIGTGSRLASVGRGVLDVRDLVYYFSLTIGLLLLNYVLLEAKRWSEGVSTRARRMALALTAALVVGNLLALNINLAPVRAARIDMTARNEYSVSPTTEKLLAQLDAPLLIRGYFSEKTHPLLAPLVPRIRDLIKEYDVIGGANVEAQFIDPRKHPALEKEANEDFGIKSFPFQFADRRQATVVNSYFHVLIKYGDKHEVLTFEDLIEVKVAGIGKVEVKLRNLEYDLTRTIKKAVFGFQPLDEVFARVAGKVQIKSFVTPKTVPDNFKKVPERLAKVAKALAARSGGKLVFEQIDPTGPGKEQLRRELFEKHGFRPLAASLFSQDTFYLYALVQVGDRYERLMPAPDMSETDIKNEIEAALKRVVPGFLKTVAILSAEPKRPPMNPMMMRRPPPPQDKHRMLRAKLSENYQVRSVQLKDGRVPGDVDVLFIVAPDTLDEKQRFAIDQYLMRGGAVIVAQGAYVMEASMRGGISVKGKETKLEELLAAWGVGFDKKLVLDQQNEAFPIPVERDVMGMRMREIQLLPYPYWVDIRSDKMAEGEVTVSSLPSVTLQWASPLKLETSKDVKTTVILSSSDGSWLSDSTSVQPDFDRYPKLGFGPEKGAKLGSSPLAVLATGQFSSAFAGKASPLFGEGEAKGATAEKRAGRTLERSVKGARLAVVGSSEFLNDEVLGLSRQTNAERYLNNLRLAQNLVDWAVADTDLLSIRARGTYARTLRPIDESQQVKWEVGNYGFAVLALAGLIALVTIRRRSVKPLALQSKKEDA